MEEEDINLNESVATSKTKLEALARYALENCYQSKKFIESMNPKDDEDRLRMAVRMVKMSLVEMARQVAFHKTKQEKATLAKMFKLMERISKNSNKNVH